jgi:lysophospholipase L1-like esterase
VNARADRVLVLSIPDWGVTPFAFASGRDRQLIADQLDAYNAAAREVCAAHGVAFVDITGISRDGGDAPDMLAEDGLHPSAAMYARWAEAALPVAMELLAPP